MMHRVKRNHAYTRDPIEPAYMQHVHIHNPFCANEKNMHSWINTVLVDIEGLNSHQGWPTPLARSHTFSVAVGALCDVTTSEARNILLERGDGKEEADLSHAAFFQTLSDPCLARGQVTHFCRS